MMKCVTSVGPKTIYIEALKYHPLGILKGDQPDCIGLHLSEMLANGSPIVGPKFNCRHFCII